MSPSLGSHFISLREFKSVARESESLRFFIHRLSHKLTDPLSTHHIHHYWPSLTTRMPFPCVPPGIFPHISLPNHILTPQTTTSQLGNQRIDLRSFRTYITREKEMMDLETNQISFLKGEIARNQEIVQQLVHEKDSIILECRRELSKQYARTSHLEHELARKEAQRLKLEEMLLHQTADSQHLQSTLQAALDKVTELEENMADKCKQIDATQVLHRSLMEELNSSRETLTDALDNERSRRLNHEKENEHLSRTKQTLESQVEELNQRSLDMEREIVQLKYEIIHRDIESRWEALNERRRVESTGMAIKSAAEGALGVIGRFTTSVAARFLNVFSGHNLGEEDEE